MNSAEFPPSGITSSNVMDPALLSSFFRRIGALSLPIVPDLVPEGVDGEIWQLAVFGDICLECRFQWWSDPPVRWKPLADLAASMVAEFGGADRSSG